MKEVFTEVESGSGTCTGVWAQRLAWTESFLRPKGQEQKHGGPETAGEEVTHL